MTLCLVEFIADAARGLDSPDLDLIENIIKTFQYMVIDGKTAHG